jgi:hypothetical protein
VRVMASSTRLDTAEFTSEYLLGKKILFSVWGDRVGAGRLRMDENGYYTNFLKEKVRLPEGTEVAYINKSLVIKLKLRLPKEK